jgi:hypothetical protein
MKKIIIILFILGFFNLLFAGKVTEVKGQADVMQDGKWQKAEAGMAIDNNTKIMTGINSSLKIETKGGFYIVKELSMVTFNEISKDKSLDQKVSIEVGKVRVRFTKIAGIKSSFKVQTPKGTASVRGTEKEPSYFPIAGMNVLVIEGSSDISDNNGNSFIARQGESGGVSSDGDIYGESDLDEEAAGYMDQFGDDDIGSLGDDLSEFFNDYFRLFSNEPERL